MANARPARFVRAAVRAVAAPLLFACLLALSGCFSHNTLPRAAPPIPFPAQEPERIPISVWTSWPAIVDALEAEVPRCDPDEESAVCPASDGLDHFILRHEDSWWPIDQHMLGQQLGIEGSAWRRDPVKITVSGNHFEASVNVRYRVRLGLLSGRQLASCGYTDAPREVTVHLDGDLRFAAEWYVDPRVTVDIIALNRCTATFLGIDITGGLIGPMRDALQKEADDIVQRIRELTNIRARTAAIWTSLNQPILIGDGVWFSPNLLDAHIRPPQVTPDGQYLSVALALEGKPQVHIGAKPPTPKTPLPPLTTGDVGPDFTVKVRGDITYAEAAAILKQRLVDTKLHGVRITGITVSGRGRYLVVAIEVRGAVSATLYLYGVPRFRPAPGHAVGGELALDRAKFTYTAHNIISQIAIGLYRRKIEETLEQYSWWDVTADLKAGLAGLEMGLNRQLTAQALLISNLNEFGPGEVRVGTEGLEAWYRISGTVDVVVTPFSWPRSDRRFAPPEPP